jgi:hypothetical protein
MLNHREEIDLTEMFKRVFMGSSFMNYFAPEHDGSVRLPIEVRAKLYEMRRRLISDTSDGGFFVPEEFAFELFCLIAPGYEGEC